MEKRIDFDRAAPGIAQAVFGPGDDLNQSGLEPRTRGGVART